MNKENDNLRNSTTQSKNVSHQTSEKEGQCVNMAFTDDNYDFIITGSYKLCINFTKFINLVISLTSNEEINIFLDKNPWRKGQSSAPKRRGNHLKRIYFKLKPENYEKLRNVAKQNDSSKTVIVNVILEIYRKNHDTRS